MSSLNPVHASIDQGLDRKSLKLITKRFLQVNQGRIDRTRMALQRQQQLFLDVLPMLFHCNHPMLPGYVSHDTPKGVANFNPNKTDVHRAQRVARSFTYKRNPTMLRQIEGIYLMGSCGTIGQSTISDLDIWISHPSSLSIEARAELKRKCNLIERWAAQISLEVHFFLMDADAFREGRRSELSTEDCGSAQHFLLLDEFYRTGLLLAGRPPIWWLVPPEEEHNYNYYADTLRKKRFVRPHDTVDFGGIPEIPAGEFVGAGVWQLYKGIDSPYKSVLKLLLTEVYASEYPNSENLGSIYKRAIFDDQLDIDELDPYVMIYRKLESYLRKRNELKRLELIRRCFYFKVGKKLSRPSMTRPPSWQRLLMQKLVQEWGWSKSHLQNLDNRRHWKAPQVAEERKELVRELTNSYRFLTDFARRNQSEAHISAHELQILGRKLYAAFERKAEKLELINPGVTHSLAEETLCFCQQQNQGDINWVVYPQSLQRHEAPSTPALKRGRHLLEVIAWCHFNGVMDLSTQLDFQGGEHELSDFELQNIARTLQQIMPAEKPSYIGSQNYSKNAYISQIALFVNVAVDPMKRIKQRGLDRLSDRTDSLGYSGLRENLVLNIESITINSWGEISSKRFSGEEALLSCIRDYMQTVPPGAPQALPKLDIRCFCPSRAPSITQRVEELFRDIITCYYTGMQSTSSRYVLEIRNHFYVLQYQDKKLQIQCAQSETALEQLLGAPQQSYSPIQFDRYTLIHSPLSVICKSSIADTIQVYFQTFTENARVWIIDEFHSLFSYECDYRDTPTLLNHLQSFLSSMQLRQQHCLPTSDSELVRQSPVTYHEIRQHHRNAPPVVRHHTVQLSVVNNYFSVQAIASRGSNEQLVFDIYCDQQEFTHLEWGEDLYAAVARFILARRSKNDRYACYITDLDLTAAFDTSETVQTVEYLGYKLRLEEELNRALRKV